jgi:Protein of unknown function (DUF3302)
MLGDPFLNYFALGLLIFVVVVIFYGIIAIHDIPAKIAEARHHPHADAIHAAGWVSLDGPSRYLHQALAPSFAATQNLVKDAQLGELRISRRTLTVMLSSAQRKTRTRLYEKAIGVLIWLAFAGLASALFMPVVNWLVTNAPPGPKFLPVRFGSLADIAARRRDVRFTPESRH